MSQAVLDLKQRTLAELETVIERGQQTFVEVGQALMEIRDGRLYSEQGYPTFEEYCQRRWGWSRVTAYRHIQAAEIIQMLPRGNTPTTEYQARELVTLTPEQRIEVAKRVEFDKVSAPEVREVVREIKNNGMAVHYSSESAEWYTPPEIVQRVVRVFGQIDMDPCSNSAVNPTVPATWVYTKEDDGLAQTWTGRTYMNPPYGRVIGDWITKLCAEYEAGNVTAAIALVPARVDTDWWRMMRDQTVCFIDGRLKFSGMENSAPFPSAIIYFGKDLRAFNTAFGDMGDIWIRYRD